MWKGFSTEFPNSDGVLTLITSMQPHKGNQGLNMSLRNILLVFGHILPWPYLFIYLNKLIANNLQNYKQMLLFPKLKPKEISSSKPEFKPAAIQT